MHFLRVPGRQIKDQLGPKQMVVLPPETGHRDNGRLGVRGVALGTVGEPKICSVKVSKGAVAGFLEQGGR